MVELNGGYASFLREVGQMHSQVIVIDAGLATSMQTDLFRDAFPKRYFNLGIAEQNAVGVASGLARKGFVPLIHSFSNFLTRRAHDQIAVSVAWSGCNVKLIGGSCGLFDARNGPSHAAVDDLATMAALPGVMVVEPADLAQTRALLFNIISYQGPAYLRLRRSGMPRDLLGHTSSHGHTVVVKSLSCAVCTLVAGGSMLAEAIQASRMLADRRIAVDLIHAPMLRPFDAEAIIASAGRTKLVVTLENHVASGGFGDAVARAVGPLGIRNERLALPDEFLPAGDPQWQLVHCRLDAASVTTRIVQMLNGR
jgi:transketolase